jgi:ribonuclease HII
MGRHEVRSSLIGIDEVGRGALAGPVVVAAAMVTHGIVFDVANLGTLKDSKKLSAKQRGAWLGYFKKHPDIAFAVARVYPRAIEKMNISAAANLAALRAYKKLISKGGKKARTGSSVLLDGGLYLSSKKWQAENAPSAKTIVKADEKFIAVRIASIVAKVHRDDFMRKLTKKYPKYGFEVHKGYGTAVHRAAIERHGPSDVHRLTFLKRKISM